MAFDAIAHEDHRRLRPQQMLAVMKWIRQARAGLRASGAHGLPVTGGPDYSFEFAEGHVIRESADDSAIASAADEAYTGRCIGLCAEAAGTVRICRRLTTGYC
jgi:hypothetical protein